MKQQQKSFFKKINSFRIYFRIKLALVSHFKKWAIPGLFFFIFVVSIQLKEKISIKKFANDWIWTVDLWSWIWLLNQLSHNHFPLVSNFCAGLKKLTFYFDEPSQIPWIGK